MQQFTGRLFIGLGAVAIVLVTAALSFWATGADMRGYFLSVARVSFLAMLGGLVIQRLTSQTGRSLFPAWAMLTLLALGGGAAAGRRRGGGGAAAGALILS